MFSNEARLTKEQALQILANAVAQMKLTLQEHQMLQQALMVLEADDKAKDT